MMRATTTGLSPRVVDFERTWGELSRGVASVITLSGVTQGMAFYEKVYALCTANPRPHTEQLYCRLRAFLAEHADATAARVCAAADPLAEYGRAWRTFSVGAEYLHAMFRYLNQHWVSRVVQESKQRLGCLYQGPAGFFPSAGSPSKPTSSASSTSSSGSSSGGGVGEVCEVGTLCLILWRDHVYARARELLVGGALKAIETDRLGDISADTGPVVGLVASLLRLGALNKKSPLELYQRDFEDPVLRETAAFYARESEDFIATRGIAEYLEIAEARLDAELARGRRLLDPSSLEALRHACCASLSDRHAAAVVSECGAFFDAGATRPLNRAYRLLRLSTASSHEGTLPLRSLLEQWMVRRGASQLAALSKEEREDPTRFVETLFAVHSADAELVEHAFEADFQFVASMDNALRKVVNGPTAAASASAAGGGIGGPSRAPEFLARYCDLLLRRGAVIPAQVAPSSAAGGEPPKQARPNSARASPSAAISASSGIGGGGGGGGGGSGGGMDEKLGQVVTIFRYIEDRDVFQKFYSRLLARRLIMGASTSEDAESAMIAGIKQVCGFEYVNRLARMFNDMAISTELTEAFCGSLASPLHFDFTANVLTSGFWPLQTGGGVGGGVQEQLRLPQDIERCIKAFSAFYINRHQGRKLQWMHHLGRGELRSAAMKRPYELQMPAPLMVVLLAFNDSAEMSANDVQLACGFPVVQDATRSLRTLVDTKLLTEGPNKLFSVNTAFASRRIKVRIGGGGGGGGGERAKEKQQEAAAEYKGLEEDRKLYLQAAIVRVMKSRKELRHVQLVQEVISQARGRFVPNIPSIKRCIESLIEKEFLRRVDGQSDCYAYIA